MAGPSALCVRVGLLFLVLLLAVYPKPFLSVDDQIALLQSRGMSVTEPEKAKHYLAQINYYRLSAYWFPFRQATTTQNAATGQAQTQILDDLKPDIHFTHVIDFYVFDKRLRLLVLDVLERIEIALRTNISILLGQRDPCAHRDGSQLHGHFSRRKRTPQHKTQHEIWLEKLDSKKQKSQEDFAKHFRQKYPNVEMPIWVASELWDFGLLSHLYSGLLIADRDDIAALYSVPSGQMFKTWVRCLNDVRNVCAHHSRLWNRPLVNQPSWPQMGVLPSFDHASGHVRAQTRLYAALLIMLQCLGVISPNSTLKQRLKEHLGSFPDNPYLSLNNAGFPAGWENEAIWN